MIFILEIIIALIVIVFAAEVITNGFEHFGSRLNLSEGVTGSVFAAVATALPETTVPLVAIFSATEQAHIDIGIGAIIGAPLMLSSISIFILTIFAMKKRGFYGKVVPEKTGFHRDLSFFIFIYIFALAALFIPHDNFMIKVSIAIILCVCYGFYLRKTFAASAQMVSEGHGTSADNPLYISRYLKLKTNMFSIVIQLVIGFVVMILAAKIFIYGIEHIADILGIPALILSLAIIPIATEMPEKTNSILWVLRGKDTLAFGNITGAMVFQGSLLPAIGILFTPWAPVKEVLLAMIITLIASLWLRFIPHKNGISLPLLLVCSVFYFGYFASLVFM